MREINLGGQQIRVRATPLALLFYKQEFKSDLLGDLMKLGKVAQDPTQLDSVMILQLVWAMAKADAYGKQFPSFMEWVSQLESFDITDSVIVEIMEEATQGFFRGGVKGAVK